MPLRQIDAAALHKGILEAHGIRDGDAIRDVAGAPSLEARGAPASGMERAIAQAFGAALDAVQMPGHPADDGSSPSGSPLLQTLDAVQLHESLGGEPEAPVAATGGFAPHGRHAKDDAFDLVGGDGADGGGLRHATLQRAVRSVGISVFELTELATTMEADGLETLQVAALLKAISASSRSAVAAAVLRAFAAAMHHAGVAPDGLVTDQMPLGVPVRPPSPPRGSPHNRRAGSTSSSRNASPEPPRDGGSAGARRGASTANGGSSRGGSRSGSPTKSTSGGRRRNSTKASSRKERHTNLFTDAAPGGSGEWMGVVAGSRGADSGSLSPPASRGGGSSSSSGNLSATSKVAQRHRSPSVRGTIGRRHSTPTRVINNTSASFSGGSSSGGSGSNSGGSVARRMRAASLQLPPIQQPEAEMQSERSGDRWMVSVPLGTRREELDTICRGMEASTGVMSVPELLERVAMAADDRCPLLNAAEATVLRVFLGPAPWIDRLERATGVLHMVNDPRSNPLAA